MLHPQNKRKFGGNRLVFFSEVREVSRGDISAVEQKREAKAEEKLDKEGNVIRKGREAATWSVDELVSRSNATISKHRSALKELPQKFNDELRSQIAQYIRNSPGRFESDEYKGLSNAEYKRFSDSMHSRVKQLVDQFAPTENEIAAKKKATLDAEQAVRLGKESQEKMVQHAEALEKSTLDQITDDPGSIPDLPTLAQKMGEYQGWNDTIQQESGAIVSQVGDFQRSFNDFSQARNGLYAYKKFVDYFSSGDPDRQDLEARKGTVERRLQATIDKIKAGQSKLEKYGEAMRRASNEQKQKKIEERDAHLRRIEADRSLSKKEKAARKAQFEKLQSDRDALQVRRDEMQRYKDEVVVTQKENIEDKMEYAEARQDDMQTYGTIMRASMDELDRMLADPNIPEAYREQLQKTRDQFAEKEGAIYLAEVGIEATLNEDYSKWESLSDEEKKLAQQTYAIDTHITADLDPGIEALDGQIGILNSAMVQYTDSKEVVMKHYAEIFKMYDGIDAAVDNSVLQYSLANTKLLGSLESQKKALGRMSIEKPSGVSGFFEATLGMGLTTVGSGVSTAGEWMIDQAVELDHEVEMARERGLSPARYWTAKVLTQVVTAPIGVAGGLSEMGGGLVTMVGQPTNTLNGLGALVGRNPATGEMSFDTFSETWSHLGKAIIQWEHFSNGRIGVGIGKIFPDVVLTLTGVGAVAKGGKAARLAYVAAKEAGESTMQAIRIAALKGGQMAVTEVASTAETAWKFTAKAPGAVAKGAKALPGLARKAPEAAVRAAKAVRAAPGEFVSAARVMPGKARLIVRGLGDSIASRGKLGEKIFGKEAAKRGLTRREQKLVSEIQRGADDLAEFRKRHAEIKKEFPEMTESQVRLKIMEEDAALFERIEALERKIDKAMATRARFESEYHLETDSLSGMTQKQMLYTPEGMRHLAEKFGEEVSVTFADVTGMGMGNKYLHAVGEGVEEARNTVDYSFKLMKEVADEVFAGKPFEMVRFGGDEIVFLTRQGDKAHMDEFFRLFNERKREYLIQKIGKKQYERAKLETNIKAQQKKISLDPSYKQAFDQGTEALGRWFAERLTADELRAHPKIADQFRLLAEKQLPPKTQWLEPLDFYRAPEGSIKLGKRDPAKIREDLMTEVAIGDHQVTRLKAGEAPAPRGWLRAEVTEASAKYLSEAEEMSEFATKLRVLQDQLLEARLRGDKPKIADIQAEITSIRTRDPGTGAIRLNSARDYALEDLIPLPRNAEGVHVMKVDVPFFGAFNARYNYAGADRMMKELASEITEAYGGKVRIVRDGGTFYAISERAAPAADLSRLQARLGSVLEEYAFPMRKGKLDPRAAKMQRDAAVKKASTGSEERFGEVVLHAPQKVKVESGTTLWDTINVPPGQRLTPSHMTPEGMHKLYSEYQKTIEFIALRTEMRSKSMDEVLAAFQAENPELYSKLEHLRESNPRILEQMESQHAGLESVNRTLSENGIDEALKKVKTRESPISLELVDNIVATEFHIPTLRKLLDDPDILIDYRIRGGKQEILGKIEAAEKLHGEIAAIRTHPAITNGPDGGKLLDDALRALEEGKIDKADPLHSALSSFKARDPENYQRLLDSDPNIIAHSETLEAIIAGHGREKTGQFGQLTAFVSETQLGPPGGAGSNYLAVIARPGEKGFRQVAYKVPHQTEGARRLFQGEYDEAMTAIGYDHPNVNRVIDVGEDFLISETGPKAFNMTDALDELPPDEWLELFAGGMDGIEYIWSQGHLHGDIKPHNILTYMENGQRVVKVIDLAPSPLEKMFGNGFTEGFAFTGDEILRTFPAMVADSYLKAGHTIEDAFAAIKRGVESGGGKFVYKSPQELRRGVDRLTRVKGIDFPSDPTEIARWIGRGQDVKAIGTSLKASMQQYLDFYPADQAKLPANLRRLMDQAETLIAFTKKPEMAGSPELFRQLRETVTELQAEVAKAKKAGRLPPTRHEVDEMAKVETSPAASSAPPQQDPFASWGDMI